MTDDACPVPAFQTYVYTVNVLTRTPAGPDVTLCGDQVAYLNGKGRHGLDVERAERRPHGDRREFQLQPL